MTSRVTVQDFGATSAGQAVELVTMENDDLLVDVLTWGATIQRLRLKNAPGGPVDVVLGYPELAAYEADRFFLGAVVGRYANRIADGTFSLGGTTYRLPRNEGRHTLHGGPEGFHRQVWTPLPKGPGVSPGVLLQHVSPDGRMGFPGTLWVTCSYALDGPALQIELRAVTDRPTVVNLTQHAYFNLGGDGGGSIEDHELWIDADRYLPVDGTALPIGPAEPVAETPFDFRVPRRIGARLRDPHEQLVRTGGYDHCLLLDRSGSQRRVARLSHPDSGRAMEVSTDQPAIQLYSGNRLDGSVRGIHGLYRQSDGICLETQRVPDGPNRVDESDSVTLWPGEEYVARTTWRFTTDTEAPLDDQGSAHHPMPSPSIATSTPP